MISKVEISLEIAMRSCHIVLGSLDQMSSYLPRILSGPPNRAAGRGDHSLVWS